MEPTDGPGAPTRPNRRALFMSAIALSAFLLFTLELSAGRVLLPVFGGSPSVWTTALCFFTAVLFVGYLYAHVLATRLPPRAAGIAHLTVAVGTIAAMALAPLDPASLPVRTLPPVAGVLVALLALVGAPAFLLSTSTPLLSARYAADGRDPWWLYAASNAASLVGLVAYPFAIEPNVPLSAQRVLLGAGVVLLAALLAAALAPDLRTPASHAAPVGPHASVLPTKRQAVWLLAAAAPAGLLSATTLHLSTDHISSPLLWIGPLGVYLASFVVAFSERGRRVLPAVMRLAPAAATLLWLPYVARIDWPVFVLVPLVLGSYAVLAIAIHGQLALDRPDESQLTRFYLLISAGGLVATAFVALVAPIAFSDVYEYPILIVAGLVALWLLAPRAPGPARGAASRGARFRDAALRLAPLVIIGALLVVAAATRSTTSASFVAMLLGIGALVVALGGSPRGLAIGTGLVLVIVPLAFAPPHLARVRTFFGITEVRVAEDGEAHAEIHGTTLHGLQYLDERRSEPTAYFVRSGPLGDVFADLDSRRPKDAAIGVVGLGTGTLAAYQRPGDTLAFFEIDPAVVTLARDARYFTYLADAPAPPRIVLGDGRLSLATEPDRSFDLLVLDAFSSDAVPAHLLTREAMADYVRTLRPGATVAFQLTNRHFDLVDAVGSTARSIGLDARTRHFEPADEDADRLAAEPSTWVVVGTPKDVARFDARGWTRTGEGPVLTDDYTPILRLLH